MNEIDQINEKIVELENKIEVLGKNIELLVQFIAAKHTDAPIDQIDSSSD